MHSNHQEHIELHKALHDKMSLLYIFQAAFSFVKTLIGIFVPIYLYINNFSLTLICLYLIGVSITYLLLIPTSTKLISKFGFKKTILLSIPVYILHITCLNFISENIFYYILSWLSFGVHMSLFWPAFHCEIASRGDNKHRGSQIGTLQVISTIVGSLAPIIGGFLLEFSNYYTLLVFSTIIISLGILPLLKAKDIPIKKKEITFHDYKLIFKNPRYSKTKKAFAAEGIEGMLQISFWPIALFILFENNFFNIGILFTILSFLSVIFIVYFKEYFDKNNKSNILDKITKLLSINWFFRIITITLFSVLVYIVETTFKLINSAYLLTFNSFFYNNTKKSNNYFEYITAREVFLHGTKILTLTIFIILLQIFGNNIESLYAFLILGIIIPHSLKNMKEE